MSTYTPTIGLEVHAELNTASKMFCGCKNDPHHLEPNVYVCPICMGHPGTLPFVNEAAVERVLRFGQAVGATLATYSEFDRKNYFYPDIPKAYQISQYAFPFVSGGSIMGVELTRVHLEEDTARNQHDKGSGSLINFNRAGVPLMELVTEPVIHDAATAANFARELQLILQTLDISNAHMERGEMRVEANVSVSRDKNLGVKVEIKNLNSFRSVESAIQYEIDRQIAVLEEGAVVNQETRGWDESGLRTFSQRSKETAMDYRYFPDPDIPKISVADHEEFSAARLNEKIPLLPEEKRQKYEYIGLTREQIEVIVSNRYLDEMFSQIVRLSAENKAVLKGVANYLTSDVPALLSDRGMVPGDIYAQRLFSLVELAYSDKITSRTLKDLLPEVLFDGIDPEKAAMERGLVQTSSADDILPLVQTIIAGHQNVVDDYRAGKESALQFLVGQGMKQSKGAANPKVLLELFRKEITSD